MYIYMPKKIKVVDEIGLDKKNGLYALLPFERFDSKTQKAVFKVGMTTTEYSKRIENYHSYYPCGVYMCMFLTPARLKKYEVKEKVIRAMEKDLFNELNKKNLMLRFSTRPGRRGDFRSEFFHATYEELTTAFTTIKNKYKGSKLTIFHEKEINKQGEINLNASDTYVGEIAFKLTRMN